jgi:hypothetical protein
VNHTNETPFPFYPVPSEAINTKGWIEGGPKGNVDMRADSDRHLLIVDQTNNTLYELYNVFYNGTNWEAASGAFFDMNTNNRRPDTWTSADAAGLAILPGLVRYDEVFGTDEIRHAFRVTVSSTNGYVFPASHVAGSTAGALPMGARLRLKASTNISTYSAEMQRVFRAFKKYGLIVADNGSNMYVSGTYDTRWDNGVLNPAFGGLHASDFEVVQLGWKPTYSLVLTIGPIVGAGDATSVTVTAYDANYNLATGFTGTIHFTSTDGSATLPSDYTFVGGDAGVHTFTGAVTFQTAGNQALTATHTVDPTINGTRGVIVGPRTPTSLVATSTSSTQVNLNWGSSPTATQYQILRRTSSNDYATIGTSGAASFSDTSAPSNATLAYKVRAVDASSRLSPLSTPDIATTIPFVDEPLVIGTSVKLTHMNELRQAAAAIRATAGLGVFSFTDPALSTSTAVRAVHVQELRTAINQGRVALGLSSAVFTDPSIVAGTTVIRAYHLQELRNAVK